MLFCHVHILCLSIRIRGCPVRSQCRKKRVVFSIFLNYRPPPESLVYDMIKCYRCQYIFKKLWILYECCSTLFLKMYTYSRTLVWYFCQCTGTQINTSHIILWCFSKFICETWWRLDHHPSVCSLYVFYETIALLLIYTTFIGPIIMYYRTRAVTSRFVFYLSKSSRSKKIYWSRSRSRSSSKKIYLSKRTK